MRWVGALIAVVAIAGCLLPQDDELLSEFPIAKNNPPYFVGDPERPLQYGAVNAGANCSVQEFQIKAQDQDVGDLIRVRCYVDPNLRTGNENLYDGEATNPSIPGGPVFAKCKIKLSVGNPLSVPGGHLVSMVISDGEFYRDPVDGQTKTRSRPHTLSDGGTIYIPTFSTSFLWVVNTDPAASCSSDGGL